MKNVEWDLRNVARNLNQSIAVPRNEARKVLLFLANVIRWHVGSDSDVLVAYTFDWLAKRQSLQRRVISIDVPTQSEECSAKSRRQLSDETNRK